MDDISILKNSVFEAGKSVSASTVFLLLISTILITVAYVSEPNEKIQIAFLGLTLNQIHAVALLLIIYNAAFLRFVLCMNHHKCLYWQLVLKTPREHASELWVTIYPSAVNYIINYRLIYGGTKYSVNAVFVVALLVIGAVVPFSIVLYMVKNHSDSMFSLFSTGFSLILYGLAIYNMKADLDKAQNIVGQDDKAH
jgi:hypothetical protein